MKHYLLNSLLCSAALLFAGAVLAEAPDPCAIETKVRDDGTVELSNIGHTRKCEVAPAPRTPTQAAAPVPAAPPAPPAPAAALGSVSAERAASSASVDAPPADTASSSQTDQKDRRESYRDAMVAGAPGTTAANPAVSRRYKMMDKATYQATVLGGTPPAQDSGATAPQ